MKTQTIVYHFPVLNLLNNNTLTDVGSITVDFSGIKGVSIQDSFLVVNASDIITGTGGTITTKRIDINVNGTGYVSISDSSSYSHTGENIFWIIPFDVTTQVANNIIDNYINSIQVSLLLNQSTGTTTGFNNVCVELYITYQFDEYNSTRLLKTAYIPIGVVVGNLSATETNYGSIPPLIYYLVEDDKVYQNLTIVSDMNTTDSTTDRSLTLSLDSGLTITTQTYEAALASGRRIIYNWKLDHTNFNYSIQHNLSAKCSTANLIQNNVFYLIVTYSFDLINTTLVTNSLLLGNVGGSTGVSSSLFERVETELVIPEDTPNARRIMALMYFSAENSNSQIRVRIDPNGSFSSAYVVTQSMSTSMRVIGAYTDSLTLSKGINNLIFDYYTTDSINPKGMNILWIVNYTSSAVNGGIDNSRTIISQRMNSLSRSSRLMSITKICPIAETDYFITNGFFVFGAMTGNSSFNASLSAEVLTSENGVSGELTYLCSNNDVYTDIEIGWKFSFCPFDFNKLKRFTGDIAYNKLIAIETTRTMMWNGTFVNNLISYTTIHSVLRTISGVVKDSSNNPVYLAIVFLIKLGTRPKILKLTFSDINGNYSFTVYDDLNNYFVYANKSGTYNIFDATNYNLAGV